VTISGKLPSGSTTPTTVYLWQELAGQSSFTRIAQATTDAAGDYTFVRGAGVVQTNASWYTTSAAGDSSPSLGQRVGAKVRLVKAVVDGTLVRLTGGVSPSQRGQRISLQRYTTGKHWDTVASAAIGARSRFTLRHRFARRGTVVLRAVFGGDARNAGAASAPLRVLVR